MQKRIFSFVVLLLTCPALASAQAPETDKSPLNFLPKNAAFVLRLSQPDESMVAWSEGLNEVEDGIGGVIPFLVPAQLGVHISNPALAGVDRSKDWYLAVLTKTDEEPTVVFAIPATDPKKLTAALNDNFTTETHGNLVLYTDRGALPALPSDGNSLADGIEEDATTNFMSGQFGIYLNAGQLRAVYAKELDQAHDRVLEGMNEMRFTMPQDGNINSAAIVDLVGSFAEKFFQVIDDSETLTVSISFDKSGLSIEELFQFKESSQTSNLLTKFPTHSLSELSQLPQGAFLYYGLSEVDQLMDWATQLSTDMVPDEELQEKTKEAFTKLKEIEFGSMVGSLELAEGENGIFRATSLAKVSPMDKLKDYMRNTVATMPVVEMPGLTQTTTIENDAETYGDRQADIVTVKQEFDVDGPQAGIQAAAQQLLFGENGMQSRVFYLDDQYLTVLGGGRPSAESALKALEGSADSKLSESRSALMEKANALFLCDLPGGLAQAVSATGPLLQQFNVPVDAQSVQDLELEPSFIGFGIAAEASAVRCRTIIPVAQIRGLVKIAKLIQQLRQPPI